MGFWLSWIKSATHIYLDFLRDFWWLHMAVFVAVLSLPPAVRNRSWKSFLAAVPKVVLGVVIPVPVFWASAFMTPDCKRECHLGWFDCFYAGKLALFPIVIWSTVALYAHEVLKARPRQWIVLGVFIGAVTSFALLLYGVAVALSGDVSILHWCLLAPLYLSAWYSFRAAQFAESGSMRPLSAVYTCLASIPFWIAGIVWSMRHYQSLPETRSDCFVVTAAGRGHASVVGPFTIVRLHGRLRRANRQLLAFWRFEELWEARAGKPSAVQAVLQRTGAAAGQAGQGHMVGGRGVPAPQAAGGSGPPADNMTNRRAHLRYCFPLARLRAPESLLS